MAPNIVDDSDFRLHVTKQQLPDQTWQLSIEQWTDDSGWVITNTWLTEQQLQKLVEVLTI